ncbi:MAG: hypothetical protein J5789_00915 [Oscillospiraceae bacterium]|nr:hypothetical protein [Oscillospiraceae bacterium]
MENRISDLLDCLEDMGQNLKPRGGNANRVQNRTFEKLHGTQTLCVPRRHIRPLRVLIAAALAVTLLCGTVFAAWKLGIFHFSDAFGPAGNALDSHAQTYEPDSSEVIPASLGYANWVKAEAGDYNLTLLRLTASDGTLRATVDVSPRHEGLPALRDSGLRLAFADYETASSLPREVGPWKDRVELTAALDEPLDADAEITLSLSGPGTEPALAVFPLDALDKAWQNLAASERHHYATSAETKDYRFSLRSMAASTSMIYAVMDVEALTEYGMAHLDVIPELALYNHSRQNSGTLLDARLVGSEEGMRRYLFGFQGTRPINEAGDSITFEILEIIEAGDMEGHPYYLFDVKLEDLVPDGIILANSQGQPAGCVTWLTVRVEALGMTIEGLGDLRNYLGVPTVELIFRDGTREKILYDWGEEGRSNAEHIAQTADLVGNRDGTVRESLSFRNPLDLSVIAAVVVDGQTFPIDS